MNLFKKKAETFTEIYSDHYASVYNNIYSKVGNPDTAGDLAQEVFLRLYERINQIEKPRQWLQGALRLVVLEHYRKIKNNEMDVDEIFDDENLRFHNGFRDTRIIIQDAINNNNNYKDERERVIFEMIAINDYSCVEVAKHLGYTERQVRYRYKLVVERILNDLKQKGLRELEDLL